MLLEIGPGAGHNAVRLRGVFECAFERAESDFSQSMLARSGALNSNYEQVLGDISTLFQH